MAYKKYRWLGPPPAWQMATGRKLDCRQEVKSLLIPTWGGELSPVCYLTGAPSGVKRFAPTQVLQACFLLFRLGLGKCLEPYEILSATEPAPALAKPTVPPALIASELRERLRRKCSGQSGGTSRCR